MARKTVIKKIVVGRPIKSVDATSVGNASQLASNPPSYYLDYTNFTNTPNILDSADVALIAAGSLDSAEALNLIDSAYIQARATNIQNLRDSGSNIVITGNLLPDTDSSRDIGSPTKKFKDLYLSGSTLFIGNTAISTDSATNEIKILKVDASGAIIETKGKLSLVDSAQSSLIIDSDFIQARQIKYDFLDSAEVIQLVDSNYVAARTFTQADIEAIARGVSLDSVGTTALIDSAYVLARGIQNLKDSGAGISVRGDLIPDTDSAYDIGSTDRRFKELYLSGSTIFLGDNTIKVDSSSDFRILNGGGVLANLVADHLHLGTDKKKIAVDSSGQLRFSTDDVSTNFGFNLAANNITDLADVNSGATAGQFLRWNGAQFAPFSVDSAYVAARTWTQADIEQFASNILLDSAEASRLIDSAVNNVIDGAPGALDTLNELAAALNDDSNAFNTLNNLIATKLTSADFDTRFDSALATKTTDNVTEGSTNLYYTDVRVSTLIDSAYITARASTFDSADAISLIDSDYIIARQAPGTDSAQVEAIAAALIDSDYVAARQASGVLKLGNVTDGALTDGAIQTLTADTKIVDAIDELNEAMLNVSNNTFVRGNTFTGSPLAGGEGLSVTLNISVDGNANRFDVDWGDGSQDNNITDSTPTHTYSSNTGSPFTVTVRAYNTSGSGVGSEASFERTDYVIIYTADPVANYNVYAAPTGGSPISFWEDGDTVYFENNTTNTTMADVTYRWTWGDGSSDNIIDSDNAAGGVTGSRIAHTFTASTNTDVQRTTQLELTAHTTADPTVISGGVDTSDTFEIYDDMPTPVYEAYAARVVNGNNHQLRMTDTGLTGLGSYSTFGNQIKHYFGDGSTTTANVGSSQDGRLNDYVVKSFPLTSSNQTNGVTQQVDNYGEVITEHGSSPFTSNTVTVFTEPELTAGISTSAKVVSDGSNDNSKTVYLDTSGTNGFVDLLGIDRSIVTTTLSCLHSTSHSINFNSGHITTVKTSPTETFDTTTGTTGHGGAGTKSVVVTATGTPDTIAQTDTASDTYTLKNAPNPPTSIASRGLTWATSSVGESPRECASIDADAGATWKSIGRDLTASNAIRVLTSTAVESNELGDMAYTHAGGTLEVRRGFNQDAGSSTSPSAGNVGTHGRLNLTYFGDLHNNDATVPSNFYNTYDFKINIAAFSLGGGLHRFNGKYSNANGAASATVGDTAYAYLVVDGTQTPSITNTGTLAPTTASGYRYIGGVPYINSQTTLTLSNVGLGTITNNTYTGSSDIFKVDHSSNSESTSGSLIAYGSYTYANILPVNKMSGSSPLADINGQTLEDLVTGNISSNIRAVGKIKMRYKTVDSELAYQEHPTSVRVYNTSSITGINEESITVSDSLGNGAYSNDGIRSTAFSADTTDNPSYTGSTNFYTSSVYDNTVAFPGGIDNTQEAGVNINGQIVHDTNNYSTHAPAGPNRSGDTGTQYFTFAFQRGGVAQFNIDITSSGIAGCWIALPGAGTDTSSTLNGWLDTNVVYNGVGLPGAGTGGNGSNGVAKTGSDKIVANASLSGSYRMNLGTANMSSSTNNVCLVRIALTSGQSITSLGIS